MRVIFKSSFQVLLLIMLLTFLATINGCGNDTDVNNMRDQEDSVEADELVWEFSDSLQVNGEEDEDMEAKNNKEYVTCADEGVQVKKIVLSPRSFQLNKKHDKEKIKVKVYDQYERPISGVKVTLPGSLGYYEVYSGLNWSWGYTIDINGSDPFLGTARDVTDSKGAARFTVTFSEDGWERSGEHPHGKDIVADYYFYVWKCNGKRTHKQSISITVEY